ncbi:MAG: 2Fe-2S iron-sulfur cluster binding domain-containing protein [Candidatus Endonucleobacter bathymodioli]|uniref:2Fe-2S iron-sulfur cluster binding domain-containing protein n=1 Tax=Candidatus Endonucleibacter bathymodioli TaxID=539814 RepID=A0AA90NUD4_9GAMM|nr:2Fe-2S iron-sulfur cluster binding domain-containing protein [Candidatus Endonucleobacter bathymodioli]
MHEIKFSDRSYILETGETLLDGLLRQGARVPYSCKSGICHSCLLKLECGNPPKGSQVLLSQKQIQSRYILACQSKINSNIHIKLMKRDDTPATIISTTATTTTCVTLELHLRFPVQALTESSQSDLTLIINHALSKQCAIENIDKNGQKLSIVVERTVGDNFSTWIHEKANKGSQVMLQFI